MVKRTAVHILTFVLSLSGLWLLLFLTSMIPRESIRENMLQSALSYKEKDAYAFDETGKLNRVEDNYADAILLNVLWNIDSKDAFVSSLDTKYYDGEEYGESLGLYMAVNGTAPNTDYTRYWHGSVVFIRPLLLFLDVNGIKIAGLLAAVFLLLANCVLLIFKKQYFLAAALPVSYIFVHFFRMYLSMEYQSTILISLLMCFLFLFFEKKGDRMLTQLAVISGVLTAFFDFLTTETLTILIPLIAVFIVREQEKRNHKFKENLLFSVKCVLCWGISYGMTFVSKWILASLVTGENKFTTALISAEVRFGGALGETEMSVFKQIPSAVLANLTTLFGGKSRIEISTVFLGTGLVLLILGSVFYLLRAKEKHKDIAWLLLIAAAVPYARYMILNNHSYLHEFFTYRAQAATVLALLGALWFNIDLNLLTPKKKKRKQYGKR